MRHPVLIVHTVASLLLVASLAGETSAGPITVRTPPEGKVEINATYKNGSSVRAVTADNAPADEDRSLGTFKFTPPDQENIQTINIKSLGAIAGLPAFSALDFGLPGLGSFEPVEVFAFSSVDLNTILLAEIDVSAFVAANNPFSEGQQYSAENGLVSGAPGIIFRDATSLFPNVSSFFDVFVDLTPSTVDILPPYTGSVLVEPSVRFGVPEPGALGLVALVLVALAFSRKGLARGAAQQAQGTFHCT